MLTTWTLDIEEVTTALALEEGARVPYLSQAFGMGEVEASRFLDIVSDVVVDPSDGEVTAEEIMLAVQVIASRWPQVPDEVDPDATGGIAIRYLHPDSSYVWISIRNSNVSELNFKP